MTATHGGVTVERLGHASVRITSASGTTIYIDPWTDVLSGEPRDADIVFVTHDDADHYDPEAIDAVASPGATIAAYEAIDTTDVPFTVVELPLDGEVLVDDVLVRTIPAYNDPSGAHVREDGTPFHAHGEVIGLLLTVDDVTIYYPSDTDFLERHADIRADVFVPPIGGHYTMDRHEAAVFARSVEPDLVVPVHYDTFEVIETDVEAFAAELEADGIRVETS